MMISPSKTTGQKFRPDIRPYFTFNDFGDTNYGRSILTWCRLLTCLLMEDIINPIVEIDISRFNER